MKNSAKGLLAVYIDTDGKITLTEEATWGQVTNCALDIVFLNGMLTKEQTLSEIRERVSK